jgi:hypothetical protein
MAWTLEWEGRCDPKRRAHFLKGVKLCFFFSVKGLSWLRGPVFSFMRSAGFPSIVSSLFAFGFCSEANSNLHGYSNQYSKIRLKSADNA